MFSQSSSRASKYVSPLATYDLIYHFGQFPSEGDDNYKIEKAGKREKKKKRKSENSLWVAKKR
jgi:hypothetical protein